MILSDKRNSNRFDRAFFVQFRQLNRLASYSLGLTVNISCDGFCFQFQDIDLENGDNLEFRFNKPQTNQSVQFLGDVMWMKKKDTKYIAGIKFNMSNKKNKKEMVKIISDFFTIPFDQLRYIQKKKESIFNIRNNKAAPIFDDTEIEEYNAGTLIHRGMNMSVHILMIMLITALLVLLMPLRIVNHEGTTGNPVAPMSQTASYDNSSDNLSMLVTEIQKQNEIAGNHVASETELIADENEELEPLDKGVTLIEQEDKVDSINPLIKHEISGNYKFYVQVASLRNPDIAHKMLMKIKTYYPEAYLFNINNFYKIRIPGINTQKQGAEIIQDIEEKLDMESILVYRLK